MLRYLFSSLSEHSITEEVLDDFLTMLKRSSKMLTYAMNVLTDKSEGKKYQKKIYLKDKKINITERDIRRRILIHLSMNPGGNVESCLSLISVVKDAERLGDYIKNLFELRDLIEEGQESCTLFERLFTDKGEDLAALFSDAAKAFRTGDRDFARDIMARGNALAVHYGDMLDSITETETDVRHAVVLALGARYLKRIVRHLTNIVSAVVNPLDEIGYVSGSSALGSPIPAGTPRGRDNDEDD